MSDTPSSDTEKRRLSVNSNCDRLVRTNSSFERHESSESMDLEQPLLERGSPSSTSSDSDSSSSRGSKGAIRNAKQEMVKNGKVIGSCVFYSFCSVSMVLANKSLASR